MIGYCPKCGEYRGETGLIKWGFKKVGDVRVCEKCGSIIYML